MKYGHPDLTFIKYISIDVFNTETTGRTITNFVYKHIEQNTYPVCLICITLVMANMFNIILIHSSSRIQVCIQVFINDNVINSMNI